MPSTSAITDVTVLPVGSVRRRRTYAFRTSVTLSYSMAGRTATTSASALAWTRHGNPSHVAHRMHALNAGWLSSSITPQGEWNGCSPTAVMSSNSRWMRGS